MTGVEHQHPLRVGVLFGGRSGEHDVSLQSAASVLAAIDRRRFDPVPLGVARDGRWLLAADADPDRLEAAGGRPLAVVPRRGLTVVGGDEVPLDVVFPVLHGPNGEDGTVQGLLELAGLPYVGAGVLASALAMDKVAMKQVFEHCGLPGVAWLSLTRGDWEAGAEDQVARIESALGYPVFTKPANLGSSVGIVKCRDRGELRAGLAEAVRYDRRLIVERGVDARELECGVLGNAAPSVSQPGEVLPVREFYDYEAKYGASGTRFAIPAPVPPETGEQIRELALAAFRALDCAGLARVDFFVERATGRVLINELNTMPGFTQTSAYPKLWGASGLGYPDLISRLIDLALDRQSERERSRIDR